MIDQDKKWVLENLSDLVEVLDMAFEGGDSDDRLFYVGNIANCARLFRLIVQNKPNDEILMLVKLLSSSLTRFARPNEAGQIVKEGWQAIEPMLMRYAASEKIEVTII